MTRNEFFPETFQVKLEKNGNPHGRAIGYVVATEPDNTYSIDDEVPQHSPTYSDEVAVYGDLLEAGETAVHTLRDVDRSGKGTGPLESVDITDNPQWGRTDATVYYRKGTSGEWTEIGRLWHGWVNIHIEDIPEEDRRQPSDDDPREPKDPTNPLDPIIGQLPEWFSGETRGIPNWLLAAGAVLLLFVLL